MNKIKLEAFRRVLFVKNSDFQGDIFGLFRPEIEKGYDIDVDYRVLFEIG